MRMRLAPPPDKLPALFAPLRTNQVSERRDHYVRYGLAFILEHGFMRTERGRMCYRMNLAQIRNAVLETAYIGVLEAYLACKMPGRISSMRWSYAASGARLGSALSQELEDFACIQKVEHGFDMLDARAKRFMRGLSIRPDTWILPEGVKIYLTNVRKENFEYYTAGPAGPEVFKSRGAAVDKANDCMIFEAKQFELPNEPRPVDVLSRRAVIGEYYYMQNHLRGAVAPDKYRSSMRDIFLYNEDKDGFSRVTLDTALKYCCRFSEDGSLDWSRVLPTDDWTKSDDAPKDMFVHKVGNDTMPTAFFGDVHPSHLRDEGLADWATSLCEKLNVRVPGLEDALRGGAEICDRLNGKNMDTDAQERWLGWLYLMHVTERDTEQWDMESNIPKIPTLGDLKLASVTVPAPAPAGAAGAALLAAANASLANTATITHVDRRPFTDEIFRPHKTSGGGIAPHVDMFDPDGKARFTPTGYGTWAGMKMLAHEKYAKTFPDIQPQAKKFKEAFENLYRELIKRFPDSAILDEGLRPPWFGGTKDGHETLFSFAFNVNQAPLSFQIKTVIADPANLDAKFPFGGYLPTTGGTIREWITNAPNTLPKLTTTDLSLAQGIVTQINGRYPYPTPIPTGNDDFGGDVFLSPTDDWVPPFLERLRNILLMGGDDSKNQPPGLLKSTCDLVASSLKEFRELFRDKTGQTMLSSVLWTLYVYKKVDNTLIPETDRLTDLHLLLQRLPEAKTAKDLCFHLQALLEVFTMFADVTPGNGRANAVTTVQNANPKPPEDGEVDRIFTNALQTIIGTYTSPPSSGEVFLPKSTTGHIKVTVTPPGGAPGEVEYVVTSLVVSQDEISKYKRSGNNTSPWEVASWDFTPGSTGAPPARGAPAYFGAVTFGTHIGTCGEDDDSDHDEYRGPFEGSRAFFGAAVGFGRQREEGGPPLPKAKRPRRNRATKGAPGKSSYSFIDVSDTLERRWKEAAKDLNAATRLAKLAFLLSPVNGNVLQEIIRSNDVFPFGFLLMRPYMTYLMGTGILTVAGSGTGETLIGHADFQLADNVIQKMHVGNFTMYLKSIVYQQQNVFLAENIFAQGYVSGNNMEFWTAEKSAKVRTQGGGVSATRGCKKCKAKKARTPPEQGNAVRSQLLARSSPLPPPRPSRR